MGTSQESQLHLVLFPFMAQGHMIPMMDLAKILSQHKKNVIVTVVTTPHNAARFTPSLTRYTAESGYQIRLVQLQFPCKEAGLPEGCENLDMLPSLGTALSFFNATSLLLQPAEKLLEELRPPPSCIISDACLPYTIHIASKFNIPRISFLGLSTFYLLCRHYLSIYNVMESIADESEYFVVPAIPDKIEMTIAQTGVPKDERWNQFRDELRAAEMGSYGVIINSFEDLEPAYAREYKKVRNGKAWCIGPLSLSNKDHLDKAHRGNKNTIDEWQHLKWLDSQKLGTVIYACFGSLGNLNPLQLIELGLALEASKRPFIWVVREGTQLEALEKWIKEDGFEERTNDRSLIIRGWAPQLLILSHPAVGGFITHSGWNSTLEAICAGVPMVTWPLFSDQFFNEKLVVQILKVGVKVGVQSPTITDKEEETTGVLVKKEEVERAIQKLMDDTSESEERRKKVRELALMARGAVEIGGTSHSDVALFIQDIMQKANKDV